MVTIKLRRVYEKPNIIDGERILVDKFWPRGIRRSSAAIDTWFKKVGPSDELRKWFSHDPRRWDSFVKKYKKELDRNIAVEKLMEHIINSEVVTFVYATSDTQHNNAVILAEVLRSRIHLLRKMIGNKKIGIID